MTVLPQSVSPPPRTAQDRRPHALSTSARAPRPLLPVWLVTMPTVAGDGTCGRQWFAVRTRTAAQAMATATVRAGSPRAVLRRRGARIRVEHAHAALCDTAGSPWLSP